MNGALSYSNILVNWISVLRINCCIFFYWAGARTKTDDEDGELHIVSVAARCSCPEELMSVFTSTAGVAYGTATCQRKEIQTNIQKKKKTNIIPLKKKIKIVTRKFGKLQKSRQTNTWPLPLSKTFTHASTISLHKLPTS